MEREIKRPSEFEHLEVSTLLEEEAPIYRQIINSAFSKMYGKAVNLNTDIFTCWRRIFWTDDDLVLCAKADGEPVGVVCCFEKQAMVNGEHLRLGQIGPVAVHPSFWRKGIGRSMMERLIEVAIRKNLDALTLFTKSRYAPHLLYERLGFRKFYTRRLMIRILDRQAVSTGMQLNPFFSVLLRFVTKIKETKLPTGYSIRPYQTGDLNEVMSLRKSFAERFHYADVLTRELWLRKHTEYPKSTSPIPLVLSKGSETVGFIFAFTGKGMIAASSGSGKTFLNISVIDDLFFKEDEVRRVPRFVSHILKQCKEKGGDLAIISVSSVAQKVALRKSGFISRGIPPFWVMYKPLKKGADPLFRSVMSYYELGPFP